MIVNSSKPEPARVIPLAQVSKIGLSVFAEHWRLLLIKRWSGCNSWSTGQLHRFRSYPLLDQALEVFNGVLGALLNRHPDQLFERPHEQFDLRNLESERYPGARLAQPGIM